MCVCVCVCRGVGEGGGVCEEGWVEVSHKACTPERVVLG